MLWACNIPMAVRLALLPPGASLNPPPGCSGSSRDDGADEEALLFEASRSGTRSGKSGSGSCSGSEADSKRAIVAPSDAAAEVIVSHMALSNTLLAAAVSERQARFVKDYGHYIQVGGLRLPIQTTI